MKIGISARFGETADCDVAFARDFAQTVEGLGFNSLWLPEHVVFFPEYQSKYPYHPEGKTPFVGAEMGLYDPLFMIAMLSQCTTRLRFSTSVLILPQRPALLTAKEVMTLDHITGGRFDFGVGAGWSAEEYAALGTPFEERGKRFDDYIKAIRAAWTETPAAYSGENIAFENVVLLPKPLTKGGPKFLIGGDSKAAQRRAARIGDGWYGWWKGYELEPQLARLRDLLSAENRHTEDADFKLVMGRPVRDDPPEALAANLSHARSLGVEEFVMAAPIEVKTMEKDLRFWADLAGVKEGDATVSAG